MMNYNNDVVLLQEIMNFIRSYVVPEGFPDSVTPSYVPYMTWRALKHFFGGAMSVFTTRALLNSVGVSQSRATSGAVAINWILKVKCLTIAGVVILNYLVISLLSDSHIFLCYYIGWCWACRKNAFCTSREEIRL
jgi:predicted oxidoreductase